MDRESLIYKAELAEQAERFDDMAIAVKEVASQSQELSAEERNLFSAAYRNRIFDRCRSWRALINDYKAKVEIELEGICNDFFSIVEDLLIPNSTSSDVDVYYYKVVGDFHRYVSGFQTAQRQQKSVEAALKAYQKAFAIAVCDMHPVHPIRLGLALNYSVFYYEMLNSPDKACQIAKSALEDAIGAELDLFDEKSYKELTLIMHQLRENLTLWTRDQAEGEDDPPADGKGE